MTLTIPIKDYERLKNTNEQLTEKIEDLEKLISEFKKPQQRERLMSLNRQVSDLDYENAGLKKKIEELQLTVAVRESTIRHFQKSYEQFNKKGYLSRVFNPYLKLL